MSTIAITDKANKNVQLPSKSCLKECNQIIYWVGEKSLGTITLQCISLINGTV